MVSVFLGVAGHLLFQVGYFISKLIESACPARSPSTPPEPHDLPRPPSARVFARPEREGDRAGSAKEAGVARKNLKHQISSFCSISD